MSLGCDYCKNGDDKKWLLPERDGISTNAHIDGNMLKIYATGDNDQPDLGSFIMLNYCPVCGNRAVSNYPTTIESFCKGESEIYVKEGKDGLFSYLFDADITIADNGIITATLPSSAFCELANAALEDLPGDEHKRSLITCTRNLFNRAYEDVGCILNSDHPAVMRIENTLSHNFICFDVKSIYCELSTQIAITENNPFAVMLKLTITPQDNAVIAVMEPEKFPEPLRMSGIFVNGEEIPLPAGNPKQTISEIISLNIRPGCLSCGGYGVRCSGVTQEGFDSWPKSKVPMSISLIVGTQGGKKYLLPNMPGKPLPESDNISVKPEPEQCYCGEAATAGLIGEQS